MNLIFGVTKLAKELGVNPCTIYRWMESENFPYIQVTERKRAFDIDEVKAWINNKRSNIQYK